VNFLLPSFFIKYLLPRAGCQGSASRCYSACFKEVCPLFFFFFFLRSPDVLGVTGGGLAFQSLGCGDSCGYRIILALDVVKMGRLF
jgi:hypothetical protein